MKTGFSWFSWFPVVFTWFSMVPHDFGKKCSKMAGKVVAAGGRDPKSAVRAHLVAEKLSLVSYFCPQACSEPELTYDFLWTRLRSWTPPPRKK